jgi:hypothetical protein
VSSDAPTPPAPSLRHGKRLFAELVARRGISESALALIAIRALLASNTLPPTHPASTVIREPAADRITIRLRPGERHTVRERAGRRGRKDSTYLAALVRADVVANPPLAEGRTGKRP